MTDDAQRRIELAGLRGALSGGGAGMGAETAHLAQANVLVPRGRAGRPEEVAAQIRLAAPHALPTGTHADSVWRRP